MKTFTNNGVIYNISKTSRYVLYLTHNIKGNWLKHKVATVKVRNYRFQTTIYRAEPELTKDGEYCHSQALMPAKQKTFSSLEDAADWIKTELNIKEMDLDYVQPAKA